MPANGGFPPAAIPVRHVRQPKFWLRGGGSMKRRPRLTVLLTVVLSLPLWSALPAEEDEQSLLPLGYTQQPSQTSECTAAIADSRKHIDSIAWQLGVENKLSDRWESHPLFRQSQGLRASNGREVRTAPATPATTATAFPQPFLHRHNLCTIARAARLLHSAQVGA